MILLGLIQVYGTELGVGGSRDPRVEFEQKVIPLKYSFKIILGLIFNSLTFWGILILWISKDEKVALLKR